MEFHLIYLGQKNPEDVHWFLVFALSFPKVGYVFTLLYFIRTINIFALGKHH